MAKKISTEQKISTVMLGIKHIDSRTYQVMKTSVFEDGSLGEVELIGEPDTLAHTRDRFRTEVVRTGIFDSFENRTERNNRAAKTQEVG